MLCPRCTRTVMGGGGHGTSDVLEQSCDDTAAMIRPACDDTASMRVADRLVLEEETQR